MKQQKNTIASRKLSSETDIYPSDPANDYKEQNSSTSRDSKHDYNSREGIANILKGSLLSGVVHVNPQTGMIRTPSPNSSSMIKNGPKVVKSSNFRVIL